MNDRPPISLTQRQLKRALGRARAAVEATSELAELGDPEAQERLATVLPEIEHLLTIVDEIEAKNAERLDEREQ